MDERSRPDRKLVISLFARSQSQYLFPGSAANSQKHVLDDRGLIRWWCKVADPLLREEQEQSAESKANSSTKRMGMGYLMVPGCDSHETRGFFPASKVELIGSNMVWKHGDPLQELTGGSSSLPIRCLIPRFPDDPKARFAIDLDDELDSNTRQSPGPDNQPLSTSTTVGRWRSVADMRQFWEAMSFRQECSAGRLVGFIWAVFESQDSCNSLVDPEKVNNDNSKRAWPPKKDLSQCSDHYYWPQSSRGEVVLLPEDYKRVGQYLMTLDYTTLDETIASTRAFIDRAALLAGVQSW